MPKPFRLQLGYNNIYAVTDGGTTVLVDTGPDFAGAREQISGALVGRLPDMVVATHAHMDHASLGAWWRSLGVPVALGEADSTYVGNPSAFALCELEQLVAYATRCGAPADVVQEAVEALARRRQWAAIIADPADGYPPEAKPPRWPTGLRYPAYEPTAYLEGADVPAGLRAIPCPGHTPGNFVLVHDTEGWLFSGDQLLAGMTPTPALQLAAAGAKHWRYRSLPAFRDSLQSLAALHLQRCFPGHGEPFDDVRGAIGATLNAIDERSERLLEVVRGHGGATVYDLAALLYPRALRRRFWQIVSTVQGHLDVLEAQGQVRQSPDESYHAHP